MTETTQAAAPPETDPTKAAQRLQDLREKVFRGEEIPASEYNEVLTALRAARRASATTSPKGGKRKSANVPIADLDDALNSI